MAFSLDGQTLASGSRDKTIKLWEMASGRERASLTGHGGGVFEGVFSVAFSPDGQTLASGSGDNTIKLWEVASGRERASLTRPWGRGLQGGHQCGLQSRWADPGLGQLG